METSTRNISFIPGAGPGEVSAVLDRSDACRSLLVLGHGSGSTMHVPFIAGLSTALVHAGVATFRYEYPYSDHEDFVPYSDMPMDDSDVLLATVRSAVATAVAEAPDLPLFAGGHSVSGLMTTLTDASSGVPSLRGVVILGFPLKGNFENASHLVDVPHPMLFLQGTDDALGDVGEIKQIVAAAGTGASLHFVDGAGHGFSVPDRPDHDVYAELASATADWIARLI
jgi:predicted alpha/beta-hydrolase family hydrolase